MTRTYGMLWLPRASDPIAAGTRCRQARHFADMSQRKAADLLQVTAEWLCRVEKGDVALTKILAIRMCEVYEVSYDWLFLERADDMLDIGLAIDRLNVRDKIRLKLWLQTRSFNPPFDWNEDPF